MTIITDNPPPGRPNVTRLAFNDIIDGLGKWPLWGALGWQDIRQRYRRSILGPFWITATLGISIGALGLVYAKLFHMQLADYLPFVATGFLVWNLISSFLNEGCYVFISSDSTIKQLPFPLSTYVYREVWRNLIVFAHNFIIYLVVALYFSINPGWSVLLMLAGVLLLTINGAAWAIVLGVFSARFRDIPQLVTNFLQVIFFVTPVLWKKSQLGDKEWILNYNPFAYLVEIVRGPLLGAPPPLLSWEVAGGVTIISVAVASVLYAKFRWRIPYWL